MIETISLKKGTRGGCVYLSGLLYMNCSVLKPFGTVN